MLPPAHSVYTNSVMHYCVSDIHDKAVLVNKNSKVHVAEMAPKEWRIDNYSTWIELCSYEQVA
jgi:hypothetical protein